MTDSYLRCGEHSHVMEFLGEIKGKIEEMAERQVTMYEKIEKLTECGNKRKEENAIIKTKLAPVFWIAGLIIAAIIAAIIEHIAKGR